MGLKKIARPINKAKNQFLKWLKDNKAESISEFEGELSNSWDYYRSVDGFICGDFYMVVFMMWQGDVEIDYRDESNRYQGIGIDEFLQLIS